MSKSTDKLKHLVIGIVNEFRGDDSFGIEVLKILKEIYPDSADYIIESSDILRLADQWAGRDIIVVDSVRSDRASAGRIHKIPSIRKFGQHPEIQFSTHGLGIREALELSVTLSKAPRSVFFIGVEGTSWEIGSTLSIEVESAIPQVLNSVLSRLKNCH